MIAIYLLPVFLAAHGMIVFWLLKWLRACHVIFEERIIIAIIISIYTCLVLDMYVAIFVPHGKVERTMKMLGHYWYGLTIYSGMVVGGALLLRLALIHSRFRSIWWVSDIRGFIINGIICLIIIVAGMVGGHINATNIRTTNYDVTIDKSAGELQNLNIVMVSDLHLGHSVGESMVRQMVQKVNDCDPDIVVIAGDIFDNDYDDVREPEELIALLSQMHSKYGVYAVYGNHDVDEPILGGFTFPAERKKMSDIRMDQFIDKCGFMLMRDEYIQIADSVYLYGRPDEERPGRGIDVRKEPDEIAAMMDVAQPIIVLEHEPKGLRALSEAGVDLHLAGHTHAGQFFPMNLTAKFSFENPYGVKEYGHMTSIVTSGVGVYGPYMRICTAPEICRINLKFRQE